MAYASKQGRARHSVTSPTAAGVCDRCGFVYQFSDLQWQYDWRGASLQNLRFLVCRHCLDTPQEQLRAIVVPADPTPIINARPQDFIDAEIDYQTISAPTVYDPVTGIPIPGTTRLISEDGSYLTTQAIGIPNDLDQAAIMPLNGKVHYGVKLPVLSVTANGTDVITVTCSAVHGLVTDKQISIEGLSNKHACGTFSVTVTTATAFTYRTSPFSIAAGALLTSTTNMVTADVGLPRQYTQIPQTGV